MQALVTFSIRNRVFLLIIAIILIVGGGWSWKTLPKEAFPDISNLQIVVSTQVPGFTSDEVSQSVSFLLERVFSGVKEIVRVQSSSKTGVSKVILEFERGISPVVARRQVFALLQTVREDLPAGIKTTIFTTRNDEILQYTLESDRHKTQFLRELQDGVVAQSLESVAGVGDVISSGGLIKQYLVEIDPSAVNQREISLDELVKILENHKVIGNGKYITEGTERKYLRSVGSLKSKWEIEEIIIKEKNGEIIQLKDIAAVTEGYEDRETAVTKNGKGEVVVGKVILAQGENPGGVIDRVVQRLSEIRKNLPAGVSLDVFYNRSRLIVSCLETATDALLGGFGIILALLFLMFCEFQSGLLAGISVLISVCVCFIYMKISGTTANLVSLGGVAFAQGLTCDAAIVILESLRRHVSKREQTESDLEVFPKAINDVAHPIIFSALIVSLICIPLANSSGVMGILFGSFGEMVLVAVLASIMVAFVFIPGFSFSLLPRNRNIKFFLPGLTNWVFDAFLNVGFRFPGIIALLGILGVLFGIRVAPFIGTDFLPTLNEGAIVINAMRAPNSSLARAVADSGEIESLILKFAEVQSVVSKSGPLGSEDTSTGGEKTDFFLSLKPQSTVPFGRNQKELVTDLQFELLKFPDHRFSFSQPIAQYLNAFISGVKSDIAVKIHGDDGKALASAASQIGGLIKSIRGSRDMRILYSGNQEQIEIEIDRTAAARRGIKISRIHELIELGIGGKVVTHLSEGNQKVGVLVCFPEIFRKGVDNLASLKISGKEKSFNLSEIAHFRHVEVPLEIRKENGRRLVEIDVNLRGRDSGGFVGELRDKLLPIRNAFSGKCSIQVGGKNESQENTMLRLALVAFLILILMCIILSFALRTAADVLIVLTCLPFSFVGGVVGLTFFQATFSVSAGIAFILLMGLSVQNGIFVVGTFRNSILSGIPLDKAIDEGCERRFYPLLMIFLTTISGHLPILFLSGSGAGTLQAFSVVVFGGVITTGLFTLFGLPVFFRWVEKELG